MRAVRRRVAREISPGATRQGSHFATPALGGALLAGALAAAVPSTARAQHELVAVETGAYELDATLDLARRAIDGAAVISLRNDADRPLHELWWQLYPNAFRDAYSLFMRTGGAAHRGYSAAGRGWIDLLEMTRVDTGEDLLARAEGDPTVHGDRTQLRTPLARPLPVGATITVRVRFRTVLPLASARSGYVGEYVFAGQWYPKLAKLEHDGTFAHAAFHANAEFYADFARYALTLRVPPGLVVGATGAPVAMVTREGPLEVHRFEARGVHDAAWVAWRGFRTREALAGTVRLRVLYPPGYEATALRQTHAVVDALPSLERRFGAYPYSTLTLVIPPLGAEGTGGMEYPTLITTGGFALGPPFVHDDVHVALHETAHQWFYGLVASDERAYPVLDEGVTEYVTGLLLTERFGAGRELGALGALRVSFDGLHGGVLGAFSARDGVLRPAASFATMNTYAVQVYSRTAVVLRTAERLYGEALVARGLARYARRWRFGRPDPEALFAALGEGPDGEAMVREFLRPALRDSAPVQLAVDAVTDAAARVRRDGSSLASSLGVSVRFISCDGTMADVRWAPGASRATIVAPASLRRPIASAAIDPDGHVPIDESRLDNARVAPGASTAGSSAMGLRLGAVLAWLARIVGP